MPDIFYTASVFIWLSFFSPFLVQLHFGHRYFSPWIGAISSQLSLLRTDLTEDWIWFLKCFLEVCLKHSSACYLFLPYPEPWISSPPTLPGLTLLYISNFFRITCFYYICPWCTPSSWWWGWSSTLSRRGLGCSSHTSSRASQGTRGTGTGESSGLCSGASEGSARTSSRTGLRCPLMSSWKSQGTRGTRTGECSSPTASWTTPSSWWWRWSSTLRRTWLGCSSQTSSSASQGTRGTRTGGSSGGWSWALGASPRTSEVTQRTRGTLGSSGHRVPFLLFDVAFQGAARIKKWWRLFFWILFG